jgi:uncharacterized GH25 family protein
MRTPLLTVVSLLLSSHALAHDFWIEPTSFTPAAGELVKLKLLVGERLEGETVPRNERLIERFVAIRGGVEAPVLGLDASDPAGLLRPQTAGGIVIAYRSSRSAIELPAEKFASYLDLEGLPKVKPGREVYSRCAKSLLAVGGRGDPAFTQPVGLTLELIPEADPYTLNPGAGFTVRVLYRQKPLARALVMALDATAANAPQRVRSDEKGRATFTLPRAGAWLIKVVHMIPAPKDAGADWESFWASLTFSLPAGKP